MTVGALRAAVDRLDPEQTAAFDREFAAFTAESAASGSGAPVSAFLRKWAVWVERMRVPATAARVRELEAAMGAAKTDDEARAVAVEMSELLHKITADLVLP
ncbi:hypothetical protein DEJ47_04795 [Streptomyces venezuelae]|uniref:Uncharacterized protein n=1 Tax=Streptomyces venezuelae TaxID=54571 RepID=A0A5P2B5L1_STRVZ|nr:hypothetical protein DEJ47_04795 [Streptomyces venezuelae]